MQPIYNGIGDRVAQTTAVTTTYYALDVIGLPEVIYTSEGNNYLHLPGVIMAESAEGEVRYLLSDGLGSIRQAVDENAEVVSSDEFDPYGNPLTFHASRLTPYAYTGEWWQEEVGLLHLRARWYLAQDGVFVSKDPIASEPPYAYVEGNPISFVDPWGLFRCDPLTGVCENGYGLCVVQGIWQGAYINGKPCIVNPDNTQTGNAPSWPASPLLPPISTSPTSPDICDQTSRCKIEMFSIKAYDWNIKPAGLEPGHLGYILTDETGQRLVWEMGPSVGFPSSSDSSSSSSVDDPLYALGIGYGSGGVSGKRTFWGILILRGSRIPRQDQQETKIDITVNPASRTCEKIHCIKRVFQFIEAQQINYNPLGTNSNAGAMTAFRDCGLEIDHEGAKKIFADPITRRTFPGWDLDLTPYIANVSSTDLLYPWFHY